MPLVQHWNATRILGECRYANATIAVDAALKRRLADLAGRSVAPSTNSSQRCSDGFAEADVRFVRGVPMFPLRSGAGDPEDAIVRAVNDTSDNDTIAAILGAAMGRSMAARRCPSDGWPGCRAARGRGRPPSVRADRPDAGPDSPAVGRTVLSKWRRTS